MCVLRFNKTKPTSGNAFIADHFELGGKKDLNKMKESFFETPHGVLVCLLTLSLRKVPIRINGTKEQIE